MKSTQQLKKILVPTDFSSATDNAIKYAAMLSKESGATIVLLHVNELPAFMTNEQAMVVDYKGLENEIRTKLEEQKQELKSVYGIQQVVTHTSIGIAIPEVKEEIEKERPDIVVMGTKGAHGWKELLIGTQTTRLIEKSGCPLIVVPEKSNFHIPSKIAFATNFNDHELQALFLLVELMKSYHPEIMVLHVAESHDEKLEEKMMKWFSTQVESTIPYDKFSFHELHGPSVELALQEFVKSNAIDLLATAKRKRNFFDIFTTRSLTKELAYHGETPLMVFHVESHSATPLF